MGCVLIGNGDGTFGPCTNGLSYSGEIAGIGDFTGDGDLDVVTGSSVIAMNLGAGNGTFPNDFTFAVASGLGGIGDFNNDGKLDVVSSTGYVLLQTTVRPHANQPCVRQREHWNEERAHRRRR